MLSDRVVIQRGVDPSTTAQLAIDVSDTSGVATLKHTVTGLVFHDRGSTEARSELLTTRGTLAKMSETLIFGTLPVEVNAVPSSALEPGELNLFAAESIALTTVNRSTYRTEERAARDVTSPIAVAFADAISAQPMVGFAAVTPDVRLHTLWKPVPARAYRFRAQQARSLSTGTVVVTWIINTSTPTMNAAGEFSWQMPDLSSVPGWSSELGFGKSDLIDWTMTHRDGHELAQLMQLHLTAEGTVHSNGWFGTISAPLP